MWNLGDLGGEKRDEGWEKHSHRPVSCSINLCNQSPVRLDSRSSWWAGMWTQRAQRIDWWRLRVGRNVSTPLPSGNNRGRGSPWPVLTPLSSHIPCLQPEKRGVIGRRRDRRSVRRKGGMELRGWGGSLRLTAGGGLWRHPSGDASYAAQPCRDFLLACYWGIKNVDKTLERLCQQQQNKGKEMWRNSLKINSSIFGVKKLRWVTEKASHRFRKLLAQHIDSSIRWRTNVQSALTTSL